MNWNQVCKSAPVTMHSSHKFWHFNIRRLLFVLHQQHIFSFSKIETFTFTFTAILIYRSAICMLLGFESCSHWWPSIYFPRACISTLTHIQKHPSLHAPGQLDEYARKHLFAELWTKKLKWPHHFCANGIPTQWSSSHSLLCWTEDKLCTWLQIIRPQTASCDSKGDPEL